MCASKRLLFDRDGEIDGLGAAWLHENLAIENVPLSEVSAQEARSEHVIPHDHFNMGLAFQSAANFIPACNHHFKIAVGGDFDLLASAERMMWLECK